jgi:hypothetical protein
MAGHARYTALLDACVLFPVAVCDSLMSVAATGLYPWDHRQPLHRGQLSSTGVAALKGRFNRTR